MLITIIKATAAAARPLYIIKMRNADENGELIGRPRFWPPSVFVTIADNNPCAGEIVRYIYIYKSVESDEGKKNQVERDYCRAIDV